jgi:hypothetical protein
MISKKNEYLKLLALLIIRQRKVNISDYLLENEKAQPFN